MIAFLCRPVLTVGTEIIELGDAIEVVRSWGGKGQVVALSTKGRWVWLPYYNKSRVKAAIRTLTHAGLWCWLLYLGIIRSEINGKFIEFLLDLCKHKKSRSSEQKSNLSHKKRGMSPQVIPRFESVYGPRTP